jgi:hypothetical protein
MEKPHHKNQADQRKSNIWHTAEQAIAEGNSSQFIRLKPTNK